MSYLSPTPSGKAPLISCVMCCYNSEKYLRPAIDSILAQTLGDFELICVDDGSADGTLAILREYEQRDPRVRVISRPNTGVTIAANDGLALARGTFYARMDSDDITHPQRFEWQVARFAADPTLVLLGGRVVATDPELRPIRPMCTISNDDEVRARLLEGDGHVILQPAVMMRADAVNRVGRYNPRFRTAEDVDLFLRLAEIGKVANLPETVLTYRLHFGSITNRPDKAPDMTGQALAESRARRGLPEVSEVIAPPDPTSSPDPEPLATMRRWVWWAHGSRYRWTAIVWAIRCVRASSLSLRDLKMLARVTLG